VLEVLNQDNAQANLARKRKRTTTEKPTEAVQQAEIKRPMAATTEPINKENNVEPEKPEEKMEEDEDSYDFAPFCENCGS